MLSLNGSSDVQKALATEFQKTRKTRKHSRGEAATRTGVPAPTIRRFEVSGEISLRQFLLLCEVYGDLGKCLQILEAPPAATMDELIAQSSKLS
jgi:hypothetical protein